MPKPAPPLVEHLLRELITCRAEGGDRYPISLNVLAARLLPPPTADELLKAAKHKEFAARAVVVAKGRADAPIALLEDADLLAASPAALEFALRAKGESGPPPWTAAQLAGAILKPLRAAFVQQLASAPLPPFAVHVGQGKATKFHHRDHSPPPPPPPPEQQDAERLLELVRRTGASTLAELERAAGLKSAAFKKAVKHAAFAGAVALVPLKEKAGDTFLLPRANEFAQFVYGTLLPRLLDACPRAKAHAFSAAELVAHLKDKDQQKQIAALLNRAELGDELPDGIGCVLASAGTSAKNVFFALEHLRRAKGAPAPHAPSAAVGDFARAFDEAFARLDRERGSNNFVSLVDLRAALPAFPRAAFDAALHELRVARRYVLNSAEHSEGLGPDQREAAIREEGEFLLHVSRGRQ